MKRLAFLLLFAPLLASSQISNENFQYEPSVEHPFGKLNPSAPEQVADFDEMIGICECKSVTRKADQTWADTTDMVWKFKYIMNGTAVQDEVWRDNAYAGSIRQFHPDSAKWAVTYFSYPGVSVKPGVWLGNRNENNQIVLYNPQKAPNGLDGFYKITFSDISYDGFNWKGEWVSQDESFSYPTWMIYCTKKRK